MTSKKIRAAFVLFLVFSHLCSVEGSVEAQPAVKYFAQETTLSGILTLQTFADASHYILVLDRPVDVFSLPVPERKTLPAAKKISEVKLLNFTENPIHSELGQHVLVTGTLFPADASYHRARGAHALPVLMDLKQIRYH